MKKRRLLAIILVTVLTINIVPLHALATEESDEVTILYSGTDGDVEWSIDSDGHLQVVGKGELYYAYRPYENATVKYPAWHEYQTEIITASVDVSNISKLNSFFSGCTNLVDVDLTNLDTSNATDMRSMFSGCSSLKNLDVSKFNTSKVTDMTSMFGGCNSLETLDLSNFDTSNVISLGNMFDSCTSLTTLDLRSFNTANVAYMGTMFAHCDSLRDLNISNFDTSKVTSMYWMFKGCSALEELDLESFNTSNVTNMRGMFLGCSSLQSLDLSSFNSPNVTTTASMFNGCNSLQSLSGLKISGMTDMDRMFSNCSALITLDCSGFDMSLITSSDQMFCMTDNMNALSRIKTSINMTGYVTLPTGVGSRWKDCEGKSYSGWPNNMSYSIELRCIPWPEGIESVSGYSISLNGDIAVNFYMELSDEVVNDPNAYMLFTLPNGEESQVMVEDAQYDKANDNYMFACNVSVAEMTDIIKAQIITTTGETNSHYYSVKQYADYILANTDVTTYVEAAPLVQAMLNYGGYSQKYFGHNTDALANSNLYSDTTDPVLTETVEIDDTYAFTAPQDDIGLKYYGSSLLLNSKTTVRHYFTITGEETFADVKANYTFTLSGATTPLTPKMSRGMVYVDIVNINAAELDNIFTLTVSNGTDTFDVSYSPFSYAKYVLEYSLARENLINVIKAMYLYNEAANAYFV